MRKIKHSLLLLCLSAAAVAQKPYVSEVWVADNGDGTYKNPIIYADYSDPDVCRVGDDYFMTASSFNCLPGLPILHSKDMVNWTIVNHAVEYLEPYDVFSLPSHGNGIWAPAIRYHNDELYIYWGDPDYGIFMVKTADPFGKWERPVLVKPGKGLIDPCPLWDDDGRAYVVHGIAGSRATQKSLLGIFEMTPDGTRAITETRMVFDGHEGNETIEGPKFHKIGDYYYIFAPAGSVKTGWQVVMRSKEIYGSYEYRITLATGNTNINGPHQGAWVETPQGESWFFHFQDVYQYGRIVHLQPMVWSEDGWPVMGTDPKGTGTGEPVLRWKKPDVGKTYPIQTPQENDDFSGRTIGLQWQWQANPNPVWYYCAGGEGDYLRLFSSVQPDPSKVKDQSMVTVRNNLMDCPNMLLQKFPAQEFSAVTKVTFTPDEKIEGERAGFIVMGRSYGLLSLDKTKEGIVLSQVECYKADAGRPEVVNASELLTTERSVTVYLKVIVKKDAKCTFAYSLDGKRYKEIGKEFRAQEGQWIGAKVGYFCNRPVVNSVGGWLDVDWFRIEK